MGSQNAPVTGLCPRLGGNSSAHHCVAYAREVAVASNLFQPQLHQSGQDRCPTAERHWGVLEPHLVVQTGVVELASEWSGVAMNPSREQPV